LIRCDHPSGCLRQSFSASLRFCLKSVLGFHNPVQARLRRASKSQRQLDLPKHSPALLSLLFYPCHLTRSFLSELYSSPSRKPFPRPSGQPSVALFRTCPRARLRSRIVSLLSAVIPKMILLSMILPEKESRDERPRSRALTATRSSRRSCVARRTTTRYFPLL
jgi:hypothetical protein